jgi:hypothetical protein
MRAVEGISNMIRGKNVRKRANAEYPDFGWIEMQNEYDKYISEQPFTNTEKGRKALKIAVLSGLYILHRPRRAMDYRLLQYYSKKPTEKEAEGRNILYKDKDKLYFSIDVFKTRWRTHGASTQRKEVLPRYIKEVNDKLSSLLKDYIKKMKTKDMSKLTPQEKRSKVEYYIFHLENGNETEFYD